jgi:hypothetical protein
MTENPSFLDEVLTGNAKCLFDSWKKLYHLSVWKNEHLLDNTFLFIAGTLLTKKNVKLLYSARYNTMRVHPIIIQDSGSGKSEAMKAAFELLKSMGASGTYTTTNTDASLLGTFVREKGKVLEIHGSLDRDDFNIWDEGTVIMKPGPYSERLQDILQCTMDEPSHIGKDLRFGRIEFNTKTAVCTGSYMDDSFSNVIMRRGLFQRAILSFKEFDLNNVIEFQKNKHILSLANYRDKTDLKNDFHNFFCGISFGNLNYSKHYDPQEKKNVDLWYVRLEEESAIHCDELVSGLAEDSRNNFHESDFRHRILNSFMSRSNQIYHIAGIISALNEEKNITKETIRIGFEIWKRHIKAANNILIKSVTNSYAKDLEEKRLTIIRLIVQKHEREGGIKKTILREVLSETAGFDLGSNNALKKINELIVMGVLVEKCVGPGNTKMITLPKRKQ